MLPQSWLLTILVLPLALAAPVSREQDPPTLTLLDNISVVKPSGSFANSRHHGGNKIGLASSSLLRGNPSLDGNPPHGTGTSQAQNGTLDGKGGLNRANKMETYKGKRPQGGTQTLGHAAQGSGVSSTGAVGGTSGGTLGGVSAGSSNGTLSHGSGSNSTLDSASIGHGGMNTGGEGTTTGTDTTTGSRSTTSGIATPGGAVTSKHKK